jgi:hypothetical protein
VGSLAALLDCTYWCNLVHPTVAKMATAVKNTVRISEITSRLIFPPTSG